MTRHLFKSVQFDFEEGNFRSGFGIKLPPYAFEINKPRPLYVPKNVMCFALIFSLVLPMRLLVNS